MKETTNKLNSMKAQTDAQPMTEEDILALAETLAQEWTSEDEFAEMEVVADEDGDNFAEAEASASDEGLLEDEILGLA